MKTKLPTRMALLAAAVLCLFSLCNTAKVYGQDYVPLLDTNKVWNIVESYWNSGGATYSYFLERCEIDTTRFIIKKNFPGQVIGEMGYLFEDTITRKVYYTYLTGEEVLLYDFSMEEGDFFPDYSFDVWKVDSIQLLDGSFRKRMFLTNNRTWIEGIGSVYGGLLWIDWPEGHHTFSANLLCYFENDSLLYRNNTHYPFFTGCNYSYTGVNTETINKSFIPKIFPNPARDELNISLPDNFRDCHTISIFDLSGRLLLQEVHCGNEFKLDVKALQPGLYLLKVVSQRGVLGQKFLIK